MKVAKALVFICVYLFSPLPIRKAFNDSNEMRNSFLAVLLTCYKWKKNMQINVYSIEICITSIFQTIV